MQSSFNRDPAARNPQFGHSPWLKSRVLLKPRGLDWVFGVLTHPYIRFPSQLCVTVASAAARLRKRRAKYRPEGHALPSPQCQDPQTGLPGYKREALDELLALTIAGSDTSSMIMGGFFFYIVRSPRAYQKLVHEIQATFTSVDKIRGGERLVSCQYLRACVDEESGATASDVAKARSSCFPFTAGTTSCTGKNLALLELYTVIASTLWQHYARLLPEDTSGTPVEGEKARGWGGKNPNTFQVTGSYISIRDGPMVQFRKRT
ncbi:cytochrome P450 [Aspergillus cavernicola]|uniref:Cytochrome P450 n=1 Tax=Aspergillus cavernicola TaxID=176166 RepID=A0ABR4IRS9_9EURO